MKILHREEPLVRLTKRSLHQENRRWHRQLHMTAGTFRTANGRPAERAKKNGRRQLKLSPIRNSIFIDCTACSESVCWKAPHTQ